MANSFTNIIPKILAGALPTLRESATFPRVCLRGFQTSPISPGSTVDVIVPQTQTATAVTPAATPPTPASKTPTVVQIPVDTWEFSDFHLTDLEMTKIDKENFVPVQAQEAVKAIANSLNADGWGLYVDVPHGVGTAGTTPFADAAALNSDWNNGARKKLNDNLAPMGDRHVVLNSDAEGNLTSLEQVASQAYRGDDISSRSGEIGFFRGAQWHLDQSMPVHDGNGPASWLTNQADHAIGDLTITIDTGSGNPIAGDIFTIAGDVTQYLVTGYAANVVTYTPAAVVAADDGDALTFIADHVVNLAVQRGAFAMATGLIQDIEIEGQQGGPMASGVIQDPVTGLILRLQVMRQWMQTAWVFDAAWGVKTVRADLACRIYGESS